MPKKYRITIQRVLKEEYEMELEAEGLMPALDQARSIVSTRNEQLTSGKYSVIRITEAKEST